MKLRIEFAHGSLRSVDPRPGAGPEGIEAFVRARITAFDAEGRPRGRVAWPEVRSLADAASEWRWYPLPDLLVGLAADAAPVPAGPTPAGRSGSGGRGPRGERRGARVEDAAAAGAAGAAPGASGPGLAAAAPAELEAHVPAEVQEHLRCDAPRTWQQLLQGTRLLQRGEAYRLAIGSGSLLVEHRPAGAGSPQRLGSELLALAWGLRRGDRFPPASSALLTELLRARWLHRRLPPGLRWDGPSRSFSLRSEPRVRLSERLDARGIPVELELDGGDTEGPRVLPCAPGEGLPTGVLRAGLAWLLGGARAEEELFLDPRGSLPREPAEESGGGAPRTLAQL